MVGYKLVRKIDGNLLSSYQTNKYKVKYKKGEWSSPNLEGSKLFYFETLEDARVYNFSERCQIWECEVENGRKMDPVDIGMSELEDFWLAKKRKKSTKEFYRFSVRGSMAANRIKLVEFIESFRG